GGVADHERGVGRDVARLAGEHVGPGVRGDHGGVRVFGGGVANQGVGVVPHVAGPGLAAGRAGGVDPDTEHTPAGFAGVEDVGQADLDSVVADTNGPRRGVGPED